MEQGQSLSKAVATVKNVDTVINGHIPASTWDELKEYAQFVSEFAAFAEREMKAGRTSAQAAKEYKLDSRYKGYAVSVSPLSDDAKANMDIPYNEMKRKGKH